MPIISGISKTKIEKQYNAIIKLQEKCNSYELFRGKIAEEIFIYSACKNYLSNDDASMLAIAEYSDSVYAIHAHEDLTEKQLSIFQYFLREVDNNDNIIVFTQKMYDAVRKYSYGKPVNVQLYI